MGNTKQLVAILQVNIIPKIVFNICLKEKKDLANLTLSGSLFQIVGPVDIMANAEILIVNEDDR